jgi:F420-dependent oxidoreductase-like protein
MTRTAAFLNPGADFSVAVDLARSAESAGYESVWVTHGSGRDSFLVLSAYAAATSRIGIGNGVVPIYPRHPSVMAQEALTLAEASGGRFRLGIGVSHKPSMEAALGLTLTDPLAVMREYVAVLRGAMASGAQFEGKHYRVQWSMMIPKRPAAPPLLLAALSSRMLELAGEIADGVVLWLCTPRYIRETAIPALERGRQRAGKSLDGFEVVAAVPLAITDDVPAAMEAFRGEVKRYLTLPFYRAMLKASGFAEDLAKFDASGTAPDRIVGALGAVGHPKTAKAYLNAYRDAGVTLPAVRPITFPDAPWYRRTVDEAIAS